MSKRNLEEFCIDYGITTVVIAITAEIRGTLNDKDVNKDSRPDHILGFFVVQRLVSL